MKMLSEAFDELLAQVKKDGFLTFGSLRERMEPALQASGYRLPPQQTLGPIRFFPGNSVSNPCGVR